MAQPTHFADYATVVTDIDRKKYGKRIVPMRVLVLGLGRAGNGKRIYQEHNDKIRSLVSPDRLLEYHIQEG